MGHFLFRFGHAGHGVAGRSANHLMYRAHDLMLARAFTAPTDPDLSSSFEIGFACPMLRERDERPNADGFTFPFGARNSLSDYEGDFGNEGGQVAQDVRDLLGYARQSVTWTVSRVNDGVIGDTGWAGWTNRLPWGVLGSRKPDLWDPTGPRYIEPWSWLDRRPFEPLHGYPYQTPLPSEWYFESHDYTDDLAVVHTVPPQNPWGIECPTCNDLGTWGIGGYPIGAAYVAVQRSPGWELLAAALVNLPAWWRPDGDINLRYVGRFG